jgi:hypothetical protein
VLGAGDMWWRGWLRYCATSRKVAGSIPDTVIGVESAANRNEYQRYLKKGNGDLCVGLTTLPPSCADCLEILGSSVSWSPKNLPGFVNEITLLFVSWAESRIF